MSKIVAGHFEPDGSIIYLPVGFKPDFFLLQEMGATNPTICTWWGRQEDDEATVTDGAKVNGADGVITQLTDTNGMASYDTGAQGPTIAAWTADTAMTARTATARGSLIRPTSSGVDDNGLVADLSSVFEAVAAAGDTKTHASTEPTWPSEFGGQVVDDQVTWEKVSDAALYRYGYQGVRISAGLMTDGQEMYYLAIQADDVRDWGDVTGWSGGVYGAG